jgi:4-hydroxy-tetrahydrodipicolinate synthase
MTQVNEAISGYWVALATPLTTSGDVDLPAFVAHSRDLLGRGLDGVVPFGTTGEGTSFSAAERLQAVEALLAAGIEPGRIALGAGFPALPDAINLIRSALALGLTHMLVLPPYFYRDVDAAGLEDAFSAVIDGVADDRLRVTLYHIPQVSGVGIPPATLAALRRRYGKVLAGLKDSSADYSQFLAFRAAAPDVALVVGNEADIGRAVADGGAGTICGMANIAPSLVQAMFDDPATALAPMQTALSFMKGPFVPLMKSILAAQTGAEGWLHVRPPLRPGDAAIGRRVAQALSELTTAKAA